MIGDRIRIQSSIDTCQHVEVMRVGPDLIEVEARHGHPGWNALAKVMLTDKDRRRLIRALQEA